MSRPVGTNVFTTPPPVTVVSGEKPFEKPDRTNVFTTPPSGEIASIPNNTHFEKPDRVTVFQPDTTSDSNWLDDLLDFFTPTNGGGLIPEASAEEETPAPPVTVSSDLESRIAQLEKVQQTYPQLPSASQKSDLDIWNHLNQWVWGKSGAESSPVGTWEAEPTAIRNIQKAQTQEYKQLHQEQETRITDASGERESLSAKIEQNISNIKSHSHNGGGGGHCECEFWDIGCKIGCGFEGLGKVVLVAGVGIIIFYAFKKGLIGRAVGKIR